MREVLLERESRPVEAAAFGDGGMEKGDDCIFPRSFLAKQPLKTWPIYGGNITPNPLTLGPPSVLVNGAPLEGHVYMQVGGQIFQSAPPLTAADPGSAERVIEQKFLSRLVVAGLINPSIQTIEQLPWGTRLTREDDLEGNRVYRATLPGGASAEATFSRATLTEVQRA